MIPLTVIAGFLGAGKTTLLNHILRESRGRRLAVLVNDFGAINIDADLIASHEGDTIALSNGCVCCSIGDSLAETLFRVTQRDPKPDQIVVEASGVADPAPVVAIGELDSSLAIHGVVVVADDDTMQAASDRYVGDTITRQLQAADLIVLNKSDLATPQQRHETLAWLDERWPQARVVETAHGAITPDLVLDLDPPGRARGAVQCIARSDPFVSLSFRTRELVQREAFGAVLDALPRSVLRAKGVLFFADAPTHPHLLHIVGRRSTLEPFDGTAVRRETRLVFIGIAGEFDTETLRGELEAALAPPAGVD
jgi:G3E family GTPase